MVMPALPEPRPPTTKSHRFVGDGCCLPKLFERHVDLFFEKAPFVNNLHAKPQSTLHFGASRFFVVRTLAPVPDS